MISLFGSILTRRGQRVPEGATVALNFGRWFTLVVNQASLRDPVRHKLAKTDIYVRCMSDDPGCRTKPFYNRDKRMSTITGHFFW
jgi:hypothetical protein